jgi:hypothetical protein
MDVREKIVMKVGIYAALAYSITVIVSYTLLILSKTGNYEFLLNSGIDVLLFIPTYVIIVSIAFGLCF